MVFTLKTVLLAAFAAIALLLAFSLARFYLLAQKGKKLAAAAVPFERPISGASMSILVLGDSTAVGTGSESPELTAAGRLAALYPGASVRNLGVNGLKLDGLLKIIDALDPHEHFSLILVQIGANDIIRLTSEKTIESQAKEAFSKLAPLADKMIVLHSGNVADAPIFSWWMKPFISAKSFEVRSAYQRLAGIYGFRYVDLIDAPSAQILRDDPKRYYSEDMLHLDGEGYGLWFDQIRKAL